MFSMQVPQILLLAVAAGYVLGSIPSAVIISRMRGVDIFSVGSGLAGATNVFRSVGPMEGTIVSMIDAAKGALTIAIAYRLGLAEEMVLLPALAALIGHWRSLFTRFRGGDGVATLVGVTVALFPVYGLVSVFTGLVVSLIARWLGQPVPTLWGGIAGYGFLLLRAPASQDSALTIVGVVFLALVVLAHGVIGHRRRAA
ncbi:MAG: glycerol-3-phosphate acyltransferase [Chloroflexi bacterium]|nr:glycerol-3-phosphate acyltransferase [Chloroflexota bacterium]